MLLIRLHDAETTSDHAESRWAATGMGVVAAGRATAGGGADPAAIPIKPHRTRRDV